MPELDYRNTLPNLKVYFLPHAGHYIQVLQPVLLAQIIRGHVAAFAHASCAYRTAAGHTAFYMRWIRGE
ncbi:MAG TPA: hypothetical protein VJO52_14620 [Gemmatimonadaceae bacterium]|nr:hypothetical protein [Gemmatimonadaceae bacterium]